LHLDVLAGYLLIATLCSYPLPIAARAAYIGAGDSYVYVWFNWFFRRAWLQGAFNHTEMIFHPLGVDLVRIDLSYFNALLSFPAHALFGDPLGYNLIQLGNWALCGFGGYHFARYFVDERRAAFIGGLVYGFSPFLTSRFCVHPNLAAAQFLPLAALFVLRFRDSARPRHALAAGAALALTGICSWYLLLTAFVWLALQLGHGALVRDRRLLAARFWRGAALAGALATALLAPFLLPWFSHGQVAGAGGVQPGINAAVGDLFGAFVPGPFHPLWGDAVRPLYHWLSRYHEGYVSRPSPLEQLTFVGYTALALAWLGFRGRRHDPGARFLRFMAFAFWVLSLGAFLHVAGAVFVGTEGALLARTGLGGVLRRLGYDAPVVGIPLPYWVFGRLPGLSAARAPSRMIIGTMLALAPLAAIGCQALLAWIERRRGRGAARVCTAGLAFLIPFEALIAPYEKIDPSMSPYFERLAQDPSGTALLNLPIAPRGAPASSMVGRYMYEQIGHRRPIFSGYISRNPEHARRLFEEEPLLAALRDPAGAPPLDSARVRADLERLEIGAVVLHRDRYLPAGDPDQPFHGVSRELYQPTLDLVAELLGPPCYSDPRIMVFAGAWPCPPPDPLHSPGGTQR